MAFCLQGVPARVAAPQSKPRESSGSGFNRDRWRFRFSGVVLLLTGLRTSTNRCVMTLVLIESSSAPGANRPDQISPPDGLVKNPPDLTRRRHRIVESMFPDQRVCSLARPGKLRLGLGCSRSRPPVGQVSRHRLMAFGLWRQRTCF